MPELSGWADVDGARSPWPRATTTTVYVGDAEVMVANVNGTLLAYRDRCAACGGALAGGGSVGGVLGLPVLLGAVRPAAGRARGDDSALQLGPDAAAARRRDDRVRIALGA